MNETQPALKFNDIFWTFQGEGINCGRRALFVRLPFCNYSCPWCDTEYDSINFNFTANCLKDFCKDEESKFAVITGGEPTINKHFGKLVNYLSDLDFEISIESNGSMKIKDDIFDKLSLITISPKEYSGNFKPFYIDEDHFNKAQEHPEKYEFKFVYDGNDEIFNQCSRISEMGYRVSLSPEFNEFEKNIKIITEYIKTNPKVRYSLQTHKWAGLK